MLRGTAKNLDGNSKSFSHKPLVDLHTVNKRSICRQVPSVTVQCVISFINCISDPSDFPHCGEI